MKMKPLIAVLGVTLCLSGCIIKVSQASQPSLTSSKTLTLDAENIDQLMTTTGAGELSIRGVRGQQDVRIVADIHSYDGIEPNLSLKQVGNKAKLVADFDHLSSSFFQTSPYVNLVVTVPDSFSLDIDDGSGLIDIDRIDGNIKINDGSGSIRVLGGNDIKIHDGSGSINLDKSTGSIDITDGSGGITVNDAHGSLNIDDGSGSIELKQIGGDTKINDGSGSIYVRHVNGKVTIDDGSGGIDVEHTNGLEIIESGSGSVRFKHINGLVSVDD
ncbi:MAG: hypothetical protein ACPGUD_01250 [Parashewanella sp.]